MKRRQFLVAGSATIGLTVLLTSSCSLLPVLPSRRSPDADDAAAWVNFANGRYTLFLPRAELGQNISTAFKQVACDELGVGWDDVDVKLPDTSQIGRVRSTVGSESVKDFTLLVAQACATLREAVAAGRTDGVLSAKAFSPQELRTFSGQNNYVGQVVAIEHGEKIVRGERLYVGDVRLPNMVFGRVLRAPVSPEIESSVISLDEAAARAVKGFLAVVRDEGFQRSSSEGIGIVAKTPGALDRIEQALAVQWKQGETFDTEQLQAMMDIDQRLAGGDLSHQLQDDDIDQKSPWSVDLRIDVPYGAHAAMEPRCAVADYQPDKLQIWVGSQDAFFKRDTVAKAVGMAQEQVTAHAMRVGGGFGGKMVPFAEVEAALLSRAVKRPVKVHWTRAQEFAVGYHRPSSSHRVRTRIKDGKITDWWHAFASNHSIFSNAAMTPLVQSVVNLIGDIGVKRGAQSAYQMARSKIEFDQVRTPILAGAWRGLGAGPNTLAIESAIDESARYAHIDPLQFRLDHLHDPLMKGVLQRVAADAHWLAQPATAADPSAETVEGRGIAGGIYKDVSYVAVIADVSVNRRSGEVSVTQLWCAHDCGLVISPDQVRAQIEGNLVWSIGTLLTESLSVSNGVVSDAHFADYHLPTLDKVPDMHISLLDSPRPPQGAGEPAIIAGLGAIANAIRDATGIRLSQLPVGKALVRA